MTTTIFDQTNLRHLEALVHYIKFRQKEVEVGINTVDRMPVKTEDLASISGQVRTQNATDTVVHQVFQVLEESRESPPDRSKDSQTEELGEKYFYQKKTALSPFERDLFPEFQEKYHIASQSTAMIPVFKSIKKYADSSEVNILITGETGTGKELVARAIHRCAERGKDDENFQKFYPKNVGNLDAPLLRSELFGHKKGSFTGATEDKEGLFEVANGGTILLDEIGELSLSQQPKLLRVIAEKKVVRIGETKLRPFDAKIISATNKDLEQAVINGTFREDLLRRIRTTKIEIPPLRNRREDIPHIAEFLFRKYADRNNIPYSPSLNHELFYPLRNFAWPENVGGLESFIKQLVFGNKKHLCKLKPWMLPILYHHSELDIPELTEEQFKNDGVFRKPTYYQILFMFIEMECNYSITAKYLDLDRKTVTYKLNSCFLQLGEKCSYSPSEIGDYLIQMGAMEKTLKDELQKIIQDKFQQMIGIYNRGSGTRICDDPDFPLVEKLVGSQSNL